MTYDLKRIRALLNQIFSEQKLRHFCLEQPGFRPVYDELKEIDRKPHILERLLGQ